MKNNDNHTIRKSRTVAIDKAMADMAMEIDRAEHFARPPRVRRRKFPRFAKKIMNDPFIFSV